MDSSHTHEDPSRMRGAARVGMVVGVCAILFVAWSLFSSHRAGAKLKEATEAQAIVTVATVKPQTLSDGTELSLPGNIQANYDAPIYARTSGYIKRWLVDIGTPVKAGQLLAEIEAPEIDQQLRQAQADLTTAQTNRDIAHVTAERWRGLRDTDYVSKQEAEEKISLAAAGDAQLQSAQANLQRLRELTGFKRILAPFDGVVTVRNADVGQLVNAGSSSGPELFRIADVNRLRLYVRVPQAYAALMTPNVQAQVKFPDRPGLTYAAKLERTSNALDSASRTLLAQLIIDNSKKEVLPGAYAEVHFALPAGTASGSQAPAFKLPANVLLFRGEGSQVATVDRQNQVLMKTVTLGRDYGTEVEIVDGLTADDAVILSPPDSLTDRAKVRVARAAPREPEK